MKHLLPHDRDVFLRLTGSVYTPPDVASELSKRASAMLRKVDARILEPSVGDGSFIRAVNAVRRRATFVAVDTNPVVLDELRVSLPAGAATRTTFKNESFFDFALEHERAEFDLVIGNPPFIKKNNFSDDLKSALKKVAERTEYPEKYLRNSWPAFLLLCSRLVAANGVLAMILPYELLTVEYGQHALRAMAAGFERVDIFVSKERAFKEIEQDAVAIIAQRASSDRGVFVNSVRSLSDLTPATSHRLSVSPNHDFSLELKSYMFSATTQTLLRRLRRKVAVVGDHCDSAPGIVSAANEFFIQPKERIDSLQASHWALPILKRGAFLGRGAIFGKKDFGDLQRKEAAYLLALSADHKDQYSPMLLEHIAQGEKDGLHLRYKCRHRPTWYEVPIVKPAPAMFFKRSHSYPRLCLNRAGVHVTDTAYGLHAKKGFTERGICFSFYNSLTMLFAEIDGRFYGGGVLELSPKEFRGLPLPYYEPSKDEFKAFIATHASPNCGIEDILDFGDAWLGRLLGLSASNLRSLRRAWRLAREHRLRHGGKPGAAFARVNSDAVTTPNDHSSLNALAT